MSASSKRDIFRNLNFELLRNGRKYTARCLFCKHILSNVATERLRGHRSRCKDPGQENQSEVIIEIDDYYNAMDLDNSTASQMDISNSSQYDSLAAATFLDPIVTSTTTTATNTTTTTTNACTTSSVISSPSATPSTTPSTTHSTTPSTSSSTSSLSDHSSSPDSFFKRPKSKTIGINKFMDAISKKEEEEINDYIARFFFGCNIPPNVIEAEPFKELMKKLRPACAKTLPSRKKLSTILLDKEYQRQIKLSKNVMDEEAVLLIDGWKNTASNTKMVVTMLHIANGGKAFLNAWDLSGESENSERLAEIVEESIELAKELYSTNIYAVISDNAANMVKMGKILDIWHSNCSAHVANLLSKDILDRNVLTDLTTVLKEFRHPDLEKAILEKGGTKIKTPSETRWCTYRDCCLCFKSNLKFMRELVIDCKKIKSNIKNLLFDDDFIENVEKMIKLLQPVSILLNKVQSTNCSLADAANLWLSLESKEPQFEKFFINRKKQALNKFAITAYFLNPYFDKTKLNSVQMNDVTDFLFDKLDGQGLVDLDLYMNRKGYFGVLVNKNLNEDASLFWRMCKLKYPSLSQLAEKLINIPASSAQIERVFSNWGYIHSDIRNRLTFERSKKLLHIYYNTKINSTLCEE